MNKKLTLSLVSAAVSGILSASAYADMTDIVITEFVDSNDNYNNRAVEVSNLGSADFTFPASIELNKQTNGGSWSLLTDLSGTTLAAGKSIVVHNSNATNLVTDAIAANGATAISSSNASFNGDDTIAIRNVADSANPVYLDVLGTVDSNAKWGTDKGLTRRTTSQKQSNTAFDLADWQVTPLVKSPSDPAAEFADLGKATLAPEYVPVAQCGESAGTVMAIEDVQGDSFQSPLLKTDASDDDEYITKGMYELTGIVTAVSTSLTKGFYLQQAGTDNSKSDAIFVSADNATKAMIGDTVCVLGKVREQFGMTTIIPNGGLWTVDNDGSASDVPAATELKRVLVSDTNFRDTLERHEGMLVKLPTDIDGFTDGDQDMRVSRTFSFDYDSYRNNMVLAYLRPNMQPNQEHAPGSEGSKKQASTNNDYRLYVDTDAKPANGKIPYYTEMETSPQSKYIRINDSVSGLEGVIHYSFSNFRLIASDDADSKPVVFDHNTDRTSSPSISDSTTEDKFAIKIATQNVLNYFNSPYGGADNTHGDNRGAESQGDFERQEAKIVEAIYKLDADILGLMEIENNGFGATSAITKLIDAVNAKYTDDRPSKTHYSNSIVNKYVFVGFDSDGNTVLDENDEVGGDAIMTGLFYRPSKVSLLNSRIITMPNQKAPMLVDDSGKAIVNKNGEIVESGSNYQRNTVVGRFQVNGTGKTLSVAVNHLKSKGSTCYEDWIGWKEWTNFDPTKDDVKNEDYQGSCENFRVAGAQHLGEEMKKEGGDQVIVGDMNAYGHEDPMLLLTENKDKKEIKAAGYTLINGVPQYGPNGKVLTESFGYINAVELKDAENNKAGWSYSYNDEIGSLDHILITPSLKSHLIDAGDWHINAAESTLYDYQNKYKPLDSDGVSTFYDDTAYRSSDHDPAIMTLAYSYNEAGDEKVRLPISNGFVKLTYVVPTGVDLDAYTNVVAEVAVKTTATNDSLALPTVELNGKKVVSFDIAGANRGDYIFTMKLRGEKAPATQADSAVMVDIPGSTVVVEAEVTKQDSLTAKPKAPTYDGSGGGNGGSVGLLGMLSLFGFGFYRRRKQA